MVSIKQLNYAIAIEKTLHFKRAADLCNVSQSTLSIAINELEKQLKVTVFERNNKQVLVTSKGRLILDKAKVVLEALGELEQVSNQDKKPFSIPMTMGVIPTIGPYLLPKVLPELKNQHPEFNLKVREESSKRLVESVRSGEIDAAILALPFPIDGLMSFEFWKEDFYWVSHKEDLDSHCDEISSKEIDEQRLMLLSEGHCLKDHVVAACQHKDMLTSSNYSSASLFTLIQMVKARMGSTLVPSMAIDQLIKPEAALRSVHLNEPGPHRTIAIVTRPNYVRTNELLNLLDIFKAQLKS